MWINILLLIFVGICAVCDAAEQKIPLAVVWAGMAVAAALHVWGPLENQSILSAFLSLIPGMMLWLLGFATGEKIGYGDGWIVVMIGLYTNIWKCFLVLLTGLLAQSAVVLVLLTARKISKDRKVPFAPFLLLGTGVVVCF